MTLEQWIHDFGKYAQKSIDRGDIKIDEDVDRLVDFILDSILQNKDEVETDEEEIRNWVVKQKENREKKRTSYRPNIFYKEMN